MSERAKKLIGAFAVIVPIAILVGFAIVRPDDPTFVAVVGFLAGIGGVLWAIVVIAAAIALYAAPGIVAYQRHHPSRRRILIVNLALGWLPIVWIAMLLWLVLRRPSARIVPLLVIVLALTFTLGTGCDDTKPKPPPPAKIPFDIDVWGGRFPAFDHATHINSGRGYTCTTCHDPRVDPYDVTPAWYPLAPDFSCYDCHE